MRIHVPPLRERKDDIPPLINHFIKRFNEKIPSQANGIGIPANDLLLKYDWPGNVRELRGALNQALIWTNNAVLQLVDFAHVAKKIEAHDQHNIGGTFRAARRICLNNFDREYLTHQLTCFSGDVARVARTIGVSRATFYRLMKRCNLHCRDFRNGHRQLTIAEGYSG